jgi:hypothetical protein
VPYGRNGSQTHFFRTVGEKADERLQGTAVLDPSECPRRVGADIDRSITQSANEWIDTVLRLYKSKAERGD